MGRFQVGGGGKGPMPSRCCIPTEDTESMSSASDNELKSAKVVVAT